MKREIIKIDENLCDGCGLCVPNCHEGALQIIDDKARLVSDLFCDGLGACIGHCPKGAISIEKREADIYDEKTVLIENIIPKGKNTINAHLNHLRNHNATEYLEIALNILKDKGINVLDEIVDKKESESVMKCGCPGSMMKSFSKISTASKVESDDYNSNCVVKSELTHWPVQLHLMNPLAPYLKNSDLLLAADCTAFSFGNFHNNFLKNKKLVIACPKLDSNLNEYVDKLSIMISESKINTLTVVIMEVPCCSGLVEIGKKAIEKSKVKIPFKKIVLSIDGKIKTDTWI
jgi:ferredoxin